jgi:hypothetical protein
MLKLQIFKPESPNFVNDDHTQVKEMNGSDPHEGLYTRVDIGLTMKYLNGR